MYSTQREYFQVAEVDFLEEIAGNVSHALDLFARENRQLRDEDTIGLYAAIVESTHDAVTSTAVDGTIKTWNPAAETMFGYSAREIIGSNISLLVPADRVRERTETLARIAGGERILNCETVRVRKGGELFPAAITMSPVFSPAGVLIGTSKIIRDITERKNAEAAVREARAQIKAVVKIWMTPSLYSTWNAIF